MSNAVTFCAGLGTLLPAILFVSVPGHGQLAAMAGTVSLLTVIPFLLAASGRTLASRFAGALIVDVIAIVGVLLVGTEPLLAVPVVVFLLPVGAFGPSERGWKIASLILAAATSAVVLIPGMITPWVPLPAAEIDLLAILDALLVCAVVATSFHAEGLSRDLAITRLAEASHVAARADRAKSEFLANMSHEIRTPLGAIIGYAGMLADQRATPDDKSNAIQALRTNGAHLLELVNQVLDLSKIEAGELVLQRVDTQISGVIAGVNAAMLGPARAKGIELVIDFKTQVPKTIESDPVRLRQILINLVGNAVKFTEIGQVTLCVSFQTEPPAMLFQVADTGHGIPADAIERMFEPFAQADLSATRLHGGTGLGLAISRRLAGLLGGELTATSVLGEGSTFSLRVPVDEAELAELVKTERPMTRVTSRPRDEPITLDGKRILLAEDFEDNAKIIRFHLEHLGAEITWACDGVEAVEAVKRHAHDGAPFHLVLMDMQMPTRDGYEATRMLRADGTTVPIIALTAHALEGDRQKSIEAGCDGYVTKPVDFGHLLATIAGLLGPGHPSPQTTAAVFGSDAVRTHLAGLAVAFTNKLPDKQERIRKAMEVSDWDEVERVAHGLAGAGGTHGFPEITASARRLEAAAVETSEPAVMAAAFQSLAEAIIKARPSS